jgi:hypothetical protein
MACCNSCAAGGPCEASSLPRLGGTRVGFPARDAIILIKPGIRGTRGPALGSFWDTFAKDYTPGTFTRAMQAGMFTPSDSRAALSYPPSPYLSMPSLSLPSVSINRSSDSRPLSEVVGAIDAADFSIPIPQIGAAGVLSSGQRRTLPTAVVGVAALLAGFFLWKKFKKSADPK